MRAQLACIALALLWAAPVAAQDVDGVIPLPLAPSKSKPIIFDLGDGRPNVIPFEEEMPFLIPKLSTRVFPSDRSDEVVTQRNNNDRTGASYVRGLNSTSVRSFRKLGELAFDGAITAQPLYARSALVKGSRQPVLIVATSNNNVFAVSPDERRVELWRVSLDQPTVNSSKVNIPFPLPNDSANVVTPGAICAVGAIYAEQEQAAGPLGKIGVEATPVLDLANNRVLVSYRNVEGLQMLAAIDLNTAGVQKTIIADRRGDFDTSNDPRLPAADKVYKFGKENRSRAGLLLVDGVVYVAFASLCETHSYGSVFAFDAKTLRQVGTFAATKGDVVGGGVWQGGTGLAADDHGDLYFSIGNRIIASGAPNGDEPNIANSAVRLHVTKVDQAGKPTAPGAPYDHLDMRLADSFTPYRKIWQDWGDLDLSSAGVVLLPQTRFLLAGGKEGIVYLLNRANFGGFDRTDQWNSQFVFNFPPDSVIKAKNLLHDDPARDRAHQKFVAGVNTYENDANFHSANIVTLRDWLTWPHIHGTPVFGRLKSGEAFMYVWAEKDRLKRFVWRPNDETFDPSPLTSSAAPAPPLPFPQNLVPNTNCAPHGAPPALCPNFTGNGMPGGMLSLNIDDESGGGVLFASVPKCPKEAGPAFTCKDQRFGALRAFDPRTLEEVWNNDGRGAADQYWFMKFVPPTVANSRVFLATSSGKVLVYGH